MKHTFCIAITIVASLLTACTAYYHPDAVDPTNLHQLQSMTQESDNGSLFGAKMGQLRVKALQDTAMSLGAQGGLAWASINLNNNLEKDKIQLETIFNFNGMMLSHGVLPPVLAQGDNSLNLDDPDTIRIADKTYKIVQQARFATTPPNWREYLWQSFDKPELPNKMLLPRNSEELKVWSKAIQTGWDKGVQQSTTIFQQNLARLKRDYQGMILYRRLLQEHKISPPFVSRTELGITGDGNDMRVNDQVLRITEHPQLQTDSSDWRAIVVKE
jgi:defect-in-organelle-trafficking protein DotC